MVYLYDEEQTPPHANVLMRTTRLDELDPQFYGGAWSPQEPAPQTIYSTLKKLAAGWDMKGDVTGDEFAEYLVMPWPIANRFGNLAGQEKA